MKTFTLAFALTASVFSIFGAAQAHAGRCTVARFPGFAGGGAQYSCSSTGRRYNDYATCVAACSGSNLIENEEPVVENSDTDSEANKE